MTDTEYSIHAVAQSLPRTPTYSGKTTAGWTKPTLSAYITAFATDDDQDATQVSQLSDESKRRIAARTLMGKSTASTVDGLISFPVVNADDNLSSQALRAAHQLAYNSSREGAIEGMTERLSDDVFDTEIDDDADGSDEEQEQDTDDDDGDGNETEAHDASIQSRGSVTQSGTVSNDRLTGVIWSTGTHPIRLGGEPTRVHVPKETIKPAFEELQGRVAAGEASIGFDHVSDGSVAAETDLGTIGRMKSIRMSRDGESIVLTDSELTSNTAQNAFASGQFDGYDFSFVGNIRPETDGNGNWVYEPDNAVRVAATHIEQVDVVRHGAVNNAQIGRIPALASQVRAQFGREVAGTPSTRTRRIETLINEIQNNE